MTLKISRIEIHGVKDRGDSAEVVKDDDADFFGLYGLVEGEVNDCYIALGDFSDRSAAEIAKDLLDNKKCSLPPQQ